MERRLVCVCGPEGMGKSVVATAVAHYLALRKRFPSGVFFAHLRGKSSIDSVRQGLFKAVFGSEALNALGRRRKPSSRPAPDSTRAYFSSSESESSEEGPEETVVDGELIAGGDGNPVAPPALDPSESPTRLATGASRKLSPRGMERMLRTQLSECKCLIVLDDVDDVVHMDWMRKVLLKILRDDKNVHLLLTCRDVPTGMSTSCLTVAYCCCTFC